MKEEEKRPWWKEGVGLAVRAGILACAIYVFLFQVSVVRHSSMRPTFNDGDRLLIDKVTPLFRPVGRFEVIVFESVAMKRLEVAGARRTPVRTGKSAGAVGKTNTGGAKEWMPVRTDFIKRVIGMPGETVEFKAGKLYVNGRLVKEGDYLSEAAKQGTRDGKWTVPPDKYFVVGDNRAGSIDSRRYRQYGRGVRTLGFVAPAQVKGLVRCRFLPWSRRRWF